LTPCILIKCTDVSDNGFSETSAKLHQCTWGHRPPSTSAGCDNPRLAPFQLTWLRPSIADISPPSVFISLLFSDLFAFFHSFFMPFFHLYSFSLSSAIELHPSLISFLYFIPLRLSFPIFSSLHFHTSFVNVRSWCRGHILVQSFPRSTARSATPPSPTWTTSLDVGNSPECQVLVQQIALLYLSLSIQFNTEKKQVQEIWQNACDISSLVLTQTQSTFFATECGIIHTS